MEGYQTIFLDKGILFVLEGVSMLILVFYKNYVSVKLKETFAAIVMIFAISLCTYFFYAFAPTFLKVMFIVFAIVLAHIFYWIFVKDNGENKEKFLT